jgi:phosphate transport system protein
MSKHMQRDLENINRLLMELASLVDTAINKATRALRERDAKLAREVIAGDNQIDREENHIDEECLKLLALHQPVASDLRRIAAVLMITTDLERMGDLAEEIAERAIHLAGYKNVPIPAKLQRMTDLTTMMVHHTLDAFVDQSTELAHNVLRLDDEVDRYCAEIIRELIEYMKAGGDTIEPGMSLFSATRHLERIADHATNIAEDVIYLVEGEIVRHRQESGTDTDNGPADRD